MTWSGTWALKCFPFTPMELQPGYIIGEERIITRLSGIFSWRDQSDADILVYDGEGNSVANPAVKKIIANGIHQFEIRMPSDHVAILIRLAKKE